MTDPHDTSDNPAEMLIGYQLRRASLAIEAAVVAEFAKLSVRESEAAIINLVSARPGRSQSDIGRALGVQRTNLAPIVKRLVAAGNIRCEEADGRSHALYLTKSGERLNDKLWTVLKQQEAHFFAGLDEQERAAMMTSLRLVRHRGATG